MSRQTLPLLTLATLPIQVALISADGQKFEVDIDVAKMSQTIKDMVDGMWPCGMIYMFLEAWAILKFKFGP